MKLTLLYCYNKTIECAQKENLQGVQRVDIHQNLQKNCQKHMLLGSSVKKILTTAFTGEDIGGHVKQEFHYILQITFL